MQSSFRILSFPLLFALTLLLGLSSCSVKQRIKKADQMYAIGEYYDAANVYKQCLRRVDAKKDRPLKAHVAFRQAECLRHLNSPRAATLYRSAIRYKYQDSVVYLRYAQSLHYQGKYKEADAQYLLYLQSYPTDFEALAGHYACLHIQDWDQSASRYKVAPAKQFNAKRSSSFAPQFLDADADVLYFTSNRAQTSSRKEKSKTLRRPSPVTGAQLFSLYSSRKNAAGEWEDIALAEGLYGEQSEQESSSSSDSTDTSSSAPAEMGVCAFTDEGRTMYFTYSKPVNGQDLGAKIFRSDRASGEWGEAQEVILFPDSSITVGHPAFCPTGDTLYFVSDAPNGFGGKDLYMALLEGDKWTAVQNLGASINTPGDEMYPYVHADGTLYFASTGHPGYGGLDLFMARRDTTCLDSTRYLVFNMGRPFNSENDDFGITFAGNSQDGFFSSNRRQKKSLDLLYAFTLPEMVFMVEGKLLDTNGEPISNATIRLVGDDGTHSRVQVRRDGTYKIKVNRNARYLMLATARGYLNSRESFATLGENDSRTYTRDFRLSPVSKPVKMDNIFYEFGKYELTPSSEQGLLSLVKLLKDNPNITIELSAHTDMLGDSAFNANLSLRRAQSVCSFLVAHGIALDRLTPVGYGKSKPVTVDAVLHKQYPFLPVDQILDPTFILSLPTDQQEICHQINRRTEFKVLRTTYNLY